MLTPSEMIRIAPSARRHGPWWPVLTLVAVAALAATAIFVAARAPSTEAKKSPVIFAGVGTQTTVPFHLTGGTYKAQWSAWEKAPEYPPCTHSAELMAVDQSNATATDGHVIDLARFVHVPATGGSDETYVVNVKPGDYYFFVDSACSWQIAISPN
jgi:hypothetical protein